jgi:putative ubiquitin-RnfH superfamily antitoxin RatB of RatAB toxin-antitoxin module
MNGYIRVEVVYALPESQTIIELELEQGARVADALIASRLPEMLPSGYLADHRLGIWGTPASPEAILRDRDRVEVHRELAAEPKQARRHRVTRQRGVGPRR